MVTQTRAKRLVKILSRLLRQEHLYTDEQLREIKAQLRVVKDEIAQAEAKTFKGFGK